MYSKVLKRYFFIFISLIHPGICICIGQTLSVSQEGSVDSSGIFGFRVTSNAVHYISVVKCYPNKVELLFSKTIQGDFVHPPVCFSNSAIVVHLNGTVSKYTLAGDETFSSNVFQTNGLCRKVGKWDSKTIYILAAFYKGNPPERSTSFKVLWFEIDGAEPFFLGERDVRGAVSVIKHGDKLLLVGEDYIDSVTIPDSPAEPSIPRVPKAKEEKSTSQP